MKELNQTSNNLVEPPANKTEEEFKFDALEELGIKYNKNDKEDQEELKRLLTEFLTYSNHELAELHMESDRLGKEDLKSEILERLTNDKKSTDAKDKIEFCPCCGFIRQTKSIELCTHLREINNIGISTYLYFLTIKNLIVLSVIMTIVYSIYGLASNVKASKEYQTLIEMRGDFSNIPISQLSTISYVSISLGSKKLDHKFENDQSYFIQCWLGLVVLVIWLFMFFCLRYTEQGEQSKVQQETISAADFTLLIENVPKDLKVPELKKKFDDYYETVSKSKIIPEYMKKPFDIEKINIGEPFYLNKEDFKDEELEELRKKHEELKKKLISLIEERQSSPNFTTTKEERNKIYDEFKETIEKEVKKYKQIEDKIKKQITQQSKDKQTTIAFVTLKTSHAMKVISDLNDPSWASKIRSVICCRGGNKFQFMRGEEYFDIKIERAPEPEDILWTNLAVPTKEYVKRKLITYSVTFILLGISFAIVFGLSRAQQSNSNNQILSLAISVFISVINIVLSIVIRKLSIYEKEYTTTKYQTSLALKSIFASLVNSILIPIIVNYYIKQDLYGKNGLASDIFMLGVTNAFIAPILKIIDISYIINRIMKYIASRPNSRLKTNQDELNGSYEYLNFEIGQEYEYLITLFLCNCFFVSLQPIIPFFGCLGLGLMYWVQKYSLLNKMKRPIPGTDHVNIVMSQLILLGGITYSLGSMTWSNFIPNGINSAATWIPNLIALGFGILMALLPYRTIIASCSAEAGAKNLVFQEKRIILSSEYDRLNPSTSAEALKQFQDFYENKMKKLSQGSAEQKTRFMNQMAKNKGRGHQRPQQQMMMMSGMPSPYMPMQMYGYGGSPFMMSSYGYGYGYQPYQYQQPVRQQPMQSSVIQPTMQQSGMNQTMVQSVNKTNVVPNQPQQQSVVNQQQQQQQQQQQLLLKHHPQQQ